MSLSLGIGRVFVNERITTALALDGRSHVAVPLIGLDVEDKHVSVREPVSGLRAYPSAKSLE